MASRSALLLRAVTPAVALVVASAIRVGAAVRDGARADATADAFVRDVRPVLERSCASCHAGDDAEAQLALDAFADERAARARPEVWARVRERVLAGEMPPPGKARPADGDVRALVGWIDASFYRLPDGSIDPGRPTLRRLNRSQYENCVRDVLGVEFRADEEFPSDDVGYGFDSIGDVLSTSDVLLEKYLKAAERIAAEAVQDRETARAPVRRARGADLEASKGNTRRGDASELYSNSEVKERVVLPRAGEYRIRVHACADQAGPEPARMAVRADGRELQRFDVTAVRGAAADHDVRATLTGGAHTFGVAFLNDYYEPQAADPKDRDRNLVVEWVEVEGPLDAPVYSAFQRGRLGGPSIDARAVLVELGRELWRRPLAPSELDRLVALSGEHAQPTRAVREALVALLVSPHFLFRVEDDTGKPSRGGVRVLDDWELATRLSFFLWNSTPDDELFALCAAHRLHEPAVLAAQTTRLLRDARASSLARDFAVQWLQIRALARCAPDPARFRAFDESLRAALRSETELFFDAILREERPVSELLLADFTFLDEQLARHYGVAGVHGSGMRRVHLERGSRNGLLGHGSILTVTSNPTRTSPVKRGKWVLDVLLGAPPPPPPPGVGVLDESHTASSAASLRERLLVHRADPACAACHARLDPLGFGLEGFDATGAPRTSDEGFEIDAHGEWPDGRAFDGASELAQQLAHDPRFVRTLAKELLVYALGRGLGPADDPTLDALLAPFAGRDPTLADLIGAIVRSRPFLERRVTP